MIDLKDACLQIPSVSLCWQLQICCLVFSFGLDLSLNYFSSLTSSTGDPDDIQSHGDDLAMHTPSKDKQCSRFCDLFKPAE